jgi:uncharacterized protein (TIGR04255 family)
MRVTSMFDEVIEVPLSNPPIVRALLQLRFGPVLSLVGDEYVAAFQERVRRTYPLVSKEQAIQLLLSPDGVTQQSGETMWKFANPDGWTLTLAVGFLTLDTTRYTSRGELVTRFRSAVEALADVVGPTTSWSRFGARFVNRLEANDYERLEEWVAPHALGARAFAAPPDVQLVHSVNECHYATGAGTGLVVRWGSVPANTSVIPDIAPTDSASWILDSDSFSVAGGDTLDAQAIANLAVAHCDATYRVFRWATTDALLRARGGSL